MDPAMGVMLCPFRGLFVMIQRPGSILVRSAPALKRWALCGGSCSLRVGGGFQLLYDARDALGGAVDSQLLRSDALGPQRERERGQSLRGHHDDLLAGDLFRCESKAFEFKLSFE